jgi:predicted metal-dependent enzyme (double-stranded beta helix superfamily)
MSILSGTSAPAAPVSPAKLAQIALRIADQSGQWLSLVRYDPGRRWYQRLARDEEHEVWLLSWLPGQHTGFHDHGTSAGAFAVARGFLLERAAPGGRPEPSGRPLAPGAVRSFGPAYVHDVCNESAWPAVSIHAYSPALSSMRRYDIAAGGVLRATGEDRAW